MLHSRSSSNCGEFGDLGMAVVAFLSIVPQVPYVCLIVVTPDATER